MSTPKTELWATTQTFSKKLWPPEDRRIVSLHPTKPRRTKKAPWWHTDTGVVGWLTEEQYETFTGRKPPRKPTKLRLEVLR